MKQKKTNRLTSIYNLALKAKSNIDEIVNPQIIEKILTQEKEELKELMLSFDPFHPDPFTNIPLHLQSWTQDISDFFKSAGTQNYDPFLWSNQLLKTFDEIEFVLNAISASHHLSREFSINESEKRI